MRHVSAGGGARLSVLSLLVLFSMAACDSSRGPSDAPVRAMRGALDSRTYAPECPLEASEDCRACYDRIGTCCFNDADPDWTQAVPALSAACQADSLCAACCNECAAMDCATLEERSACPNR